MPEAIKIEGVKKQEDSIFDLSKLNQRRQKIYDKLTNYKDRSGKEYCLGQVNSIGVFELSQEAMLELESNDDVNGSYVSHAIKLRNQFNYRTSFFDLNKLSQRQLEIFDELTNYEGRWGNWYCLGYVNSRGRFELSQEAMQELNNDDDGYISRVTELYTEFNQGMVTARNIEAHIVTSGHQDMDSGGDSFFDRLLILTSENSTDLSRTIFGLINSAKNMMQHTKDSKNLATNDSFVQTLTQAILLSFQAGILPEQMKKYNRYFSNIDQETKSKIKEKIKKIALELSIVTYFNAKNSTEGNRDDLVRSQVSDETKNASLLVMEKSQKFFQTDLDLSEVDLYLNSLDFLNEYFKYLSQEDKDKLSEIKLKDEIYTLIEELFDSKPLTEL